MHRAMAASWTWPWIEFRTSSARRATEGWSGERPRWPMIVLRSPKGWTGPKEVDGKKVEDFWRSHQVPVSNARGDAAHRKILEEWLRSYRPQELFEATAASCRRSQPWRPKASKRMGALPHANGGMLKKDLLLPDWKSLALDVGQPGRDNRRGDPLHGRLSA